MVQALRGQGVRERLHHMLLPHHFGKIPRAVLASQDDVGHAGILSVAYNPS
jgi:hypothetical protein